MSKLAGWIGKAHLHGLVIVTVYLLYLAALSFPSVSHGAESASNLEIVIDEIQIVGLRRTSPFVVRRELIVQKGEKTRSSDLSESMQRLRNLGLFTSANYKIDGTRLIVTVEERWTTIPIAKFQSGGRDQELILGAYDINVLGRYVEIGGQYERLNTSNSGVLWYRNPRLYDRRLELFVNFWYVTRRQTLYEQDADDRRELAEYLMTRRKANVSLKKEWYWWLRAGVIVVYNDDTFPEYSLLLDEGNRAELDDRLYPEAPEPSEILQSGLSLELGRLDFDSFLVNGLQWEGEILHSNRSLVSTHQFNQLTSSLRYFHVLPKRRNIGFQLAAAISDTDLIQYHQFLGGLDTIRGFAGSRFRAPNFWLGNIEFRSPLIDTPTVVLQQVFFSDTAGLADRTKDFKLSPTASSIGVGLRFISPRVYRFVGRLDYAFPLLGQDDTPISFGVQQFF